MSGPLRFRSLAIAGISILALSVGTVASKNALGAPHEAFLKPAVPTLGSNARKIPENPFRCDRLIRYRGKTLSCDSALRRDGDSLRSIVEDTPSALEELDRYQAGRNSIKFAAYSGSAGIVMLLTSSFLANVFISSSQPTARKTTAKILRWTGAGITIGSITYGLSRLRSNEEHLNEAILKYNAAHLDHPIEILFKTEF